MKYSITNDGLYEYRLNRNNYRTPNAYNKVLGVLSGGVSYSADSLLSLIQADPMIKEGASYLGKAIDDMMKTGYVVEVSDDSNSTSMFRRGV